MTDQELKNLVFIFTDVDNNKLIYCRAEQNGFLNDWYCAVSFDNTSFSVYNFGKIPGWVPKYWNKLAEFFPELTSRTDRQCHPWPNRVKECIVEQILYFGKLLEHKE